MDAKELAELLNGRQRRCETDGITSEQWKQIKEAKLVVVYGASDDLLEFEGAIQEECGAWDGTTEYVTNKGLLSNECPADDKCPNFSTKKGKAIHAIWCGEEGYTWTIETKIPHETFNILSDDDDDDIFCRGIVFSLDDVK